jgi:hypothetical protein
MWADALFIILWMTFVSVGAILVARHEFNQNVKETKARIAEIDRKFKRRAAAAE